MAKQIDFTIRAIEAIKPFLYAGESSVGMSIEVSHTAATPLGHRARAEAEVTKVEGRRLEFAVRAFDDVEQIGSGNHRRAVIDAGTAVELMLADFNRRVTKVATPPRPTLGWYVGQSAIAKAVGFPATTQQDLVDLRNDAVHHNKTPGPAEASTGASSQALSTMRPSSISAAISSALIPGGGRSGGSCSRAPTEISTRGDASPRSTACIAK